MEIKLLLIKRHLLLLFMLNLSVFLHLQSEAQSLSKEEVEALKAIGKKLNKLDWDFSVDPCKGTDGWFNVTGLLNSTITCDCSFDKNTTCHVTSLQLLRQNLTGTLPEEIANLTYLKYLDLSRNYLSGTIPPVWSSLPLLNVSLHGNRLTGQIPKELGNMPLLQSLQLEGNYLEGSIPAELGNILTLQRIFISANNFTGELPSTFQKLTSMTDFRFDGNGIMGKIPDFIQYWRNVNRIDMQGTAMTGPFPSSISQLVNLTELRVSDLPGPKMTFPPLQNAYHMTELVLRNCSIYGKIPDYLGRMQYLVVLDLSFNELSGLVPANLEYVTTLEYLYLTNNGFTGDIPPWMMRNKASNKVNMDISYNNFTGIDNPPVDCQQVNVNMVASFTSSNNTVTPSCLQKNLPCTSKRKHNSLYINCGGNSVKIGKKHYQADITQIGTSAFYQPPSSNWAYSSTGDFIGNEDANYIQTNNSEIKNAMNPELYTTARLSPLSLRYYGLCLENGNYSVELRFAEILFTDDKTFLSNGKRVFDVFIQGAKVLEDFNIAETAGGTHRAIIKKFYTEVKENMLEIHFYWGGKGTNAIPVRGVYGPLISTISIENLHPHKDQTGVIIAVVISSVVLLLLVSILLYVKGYCKVLLPKTNGRSGIFHDINASDVQSRAHYLFSLKDIEEATSNFDPTNKIGEGGFGPVYKGILSDGTKVAVKQLSSKSRQGNREFLNEAGIISALRHPNLVRLFGCCIDGNQLLLIYEFMENNSLGRALFGRVEQQLKLDWQTRYRICEGIARGLAYLHEESALRIVHRDIKATNILLDKNLNPKISDFGLAKLTDENGGQISTRIAGTVGYMAPEYATRGSLTYKADIYAFGVLTLEIVSGQMNTTPMPNDELLHLLDWAEMLREQGKLLELVDKRLNSNYKESEARKLIQISMLCTKTNPKYRPKMSSVVQMLMDKIPIPDFNSNDQDSILSPVFRVDDSNNSTMVQLGYNSREYGTLTDSSVTGENQDVGFLPSTSSSLGGISQN
ncbi:hypothetical protein LUZ60_012455 [Juncus effusus]|nr:hypothetical protein LUZ60_012455 [Juncus effusus]